MGEKKILMIACSSKNHSSSDTPPIHSFHSSNNVVSVPVCGNSVTTSVYEPLSVIVELLTAVQYIFLSLWFGLCPLSFHQNSITLSGQKSDNDSLSIASTNRSSRESFFKLVLCLI